MVAAQQGEKLSTYTTSNGVAFTLAKSGIHSSDVLFDKAQSDNMLFGWLLRVGGFFLAFIGFGIFVKLASVLGDVVPLLGSIIGFGTGLLAFVMGLSVTLLTIAVAWIAYRPVMAISLIVVAMGLGVLLMRRRKPSVAV